MTTNKTEKKTVQYKGHEFTLNTKAVAEFNKDLSLYDDLLQIEESDELTSDQKQVMSNALARTAQVKLYKSIFGEDWQKVKDFIKKVSGRLDEDIINKIIQQLPKD